MNNKLDSFNKDKVKCKKCKEYYDYDKTHPNLLCDDCEIKWERYFKQNWDQYYYDKSYRRDVSHDSFFKEFLNEQ